MKMRDSTQRPHAAARSRLATALSAALIGGAVLATPAQAVTLADNTGLGDAVIYQYYTAKSGWQTFFRLINTSNQAVVVKVRFREAANSREVLDFEVALSPNDMWTGWTDGNAIGDGRPGVKSNDTSCIFPLVDSASPRDEGFVTLNAETNLVGAVFKDRAFVDPYYADGGGDATTRLGEGHFEVIGIAQYPLGSNFEQSVSHNQGEPNDCFTAYRYFQNDTGGNAAPLDNVLAANAYLINVASGQGGGYDPNILANCDVTPLARMRDVTDTSPDLDDCAAGLFGAAAGDDVADRDTWNGTIAINQALWDGTDVALVPTTVYGADVVPYGLPPSGDPAAPSPAPGDGVIDPAQTFNFDLNGDGRCIGDEVGIQETDVPEAVFDAASSNPVGFAPPAPGTTEDCDFVFFDAIGKLGPALVQRETVDSPNGWRFKQKGDQTYAPDPDAPFALTNEYHVSGGVDWVSSLFMADSVINEWAAAIDANAFITDYYTQWVVTFPTKHYYVDLQDDAFLLDDISPTLAASVPEAFAPFTNIFPTANLSCEPVDVFMWDREEFESDFTSPAPTPENSLCNETNVVVFNERYLNAGLDSDFSFTIAEEFLPATGDSGRGWARMTFVGAGAQTGLLAPTAFQPNRVLTGLPVTGFMLSIYETGDAATNHTAINSHKYDR